MVYMIQPVDEPYDPVEPMPTRRGFVWVDGGGLPYEAELIKKQFKPIPRNLVPRSLVVDGYNPMPDFFYIWEQYFYVSSRFRAVLEQYAPGAVEYVDVELTAPPRMQPAEAYYFINVLGRGHLMNWQLTKLRGPMGTIRQFMSVIGGRDGWIMHHPPAGHPAIWHEIDVEKDGFVYSGIPGLMYRYVFVTNELGDALATAFPGQISRFEIPEG